MIDISFSNIPDGVFIQLPLRIKEPRPNILVGSKDKDGEPSLDFYREIVSENGYVVARMFYHRADMIDADEQLQSVKNLLTVRYANHNDIDPFGDVPF